jgi:hypothetical protein
MSVEFVIPFTKQFDVRVTSSFRPSTLVEKDETVVNITIIATKFDSRPDIPLSIASL